LATTADIFIFLFLFFIKSRKRGIVPADIRKNCHPGRSKAEPRYLGKTLRLVGLTATEKSRHGKTFQGCERENRKSVGISHFFGYKKIPGLPGKTIDKWKKL
jgi:hypothetical protein